MCVVKWMTPVAVGAAVTTLSLVIGEKWEFEQLHRPDGGFKWRCVTGLIYPRPDGLDTGTISHNVTHYVTYYLTKCHALCHYVTY